MNAKNAREAAKTVYNVRADATKVYNAREAAMLALVEMENTAAYSGAAINRRLDRSGNKHSDHRCTLAVNGVNGNSGGDSDDGGNVDDSGNVDGYNDGDIDPIIYVSDGDTRYSIPADDNGFLSDGGAFPNARDGALLRELVYGVTRWKLSLDHIIFNYSKLSRRKVSPIILAILRIGAYQIIFLDKIPVPAACDECVKLAVKYGNDGSVRYVNAILRKIAANCREIKNFFASPISDITTVSKDMTAILAVLAVSPVTPVTPASSASPATLATPASPSSHSSPALPASHSSPAAPASYLSLRYSYPAWICEKWYKLYGLNFAAALMDAGNQRPELSIRVNSLRETPASLSDKLRARGYIIESGRYSKNALIIKNPFNFSAMPEFAQGLFTVQDESSMLAAEALNPKPGGKILDICAAPGGKSGYIAEITRDSAEIYAADIHPHRLITMEQNLKRLGLKSINNRIMDAVRFEPIFENAMDFVLLDAPCSGLGVVRRKPEIKWAAAPQVSEALISVQKKMLKNAARYVKPGGALVYSVCTTESDECEDIVRNFLNETDDYEAEDLHLYLPPALWRSENPNQERDAGLYIYPHIHGTDGFYIARLKRLG